TKDEALKKFRAQYARWCKQYLRDAGAVFEGIKMLRVARPEGEVGPNGQPKDGTKEDTVSEGIAYGMLLSVYAGDKATFDGLWAYARKNFNSHGLMKWHLDKDGKPIDDPRYPGSGSNSATDADEDMAFALLKAFDKWGGAQYKTDAKK